MNQGAMRVLLICSLVMLTSSAVAGHHPPALPSRVVTDLEFGVGLPGTRTTTSYAYDERGNVLEELYEEDLGRDGRIDFRIVTSSTYDARGNLLSRTLERDFHADFEADDTETTTWTYGHHRRLVEKRVVLTRAFSALTTTTTTRFEYDARGNVSLETVEIFRDFDPDVDQQSVITHTYNHRQQRISSTEVTFSDFGAAAFVAARFFTYDGRGNQTGRLSLFDSQADGRADSLIAHRSTYNRRGDLLTDIGVNDFNVDGMPEVVEQTIRRYDARGNLLRDHFTIDTGANGSVDHAVTETHEYDMSGRRIRTVRATTRTDGGANEVATTEYFY